MRRRSALVPVALALAGCRFVVPGLDGGPGTVPDGGAEDLAIAGDLGSEDAAPPDAQRDFAVPPDFAPAPDLATLPDLQMPDLAVVNLGPGGDVTENVLANWDVGESVNDDVEPCMPVKRGKVSLSGEVNRVRVGNQAVRVDYGPDGSAYFQAVYPKSRMGGWNLSGRTGVAFSLASSLPQSYQGWDLPGPTIVLCGVNGAYRRLDPMADKLVRNLGPYVEHMVPLAGGSGWTAQDNGLFSLALVHSIELHANPDRSGGTGTCTMYLDDVRFY